MSAKCLVQVLWTVYRNFWKEIKTHDSEQREEITHVLNVQAAWLADIERELALNVLIYRHVPVSLPLCGDLFQTLNFSNFHMVMDTSMKIIQICIGTLQRASQQLLWLLWVVSRPAVLNH